MKHLRKYVENPAMIPRRIRWKWDRMRGVRGRLTVPTWNGTLTFDRADALIAKGLYVRRSYERDVIEAAIDALEREGWKEAHRNVVLDVGANLGMISIALVRHRFFERAVAVEPAIETFELLERNIAQNGLTDRIDPHCIGLSDTSGTLRMSIDLRNRGANRMMRDDETVEADHEIVHVPVTTFDEFVTQGACDIDRLGLIWIDVEGHEASFFRGASRLEDAPVPVVMEFSPRFIRGSGAGCKDYLSILQSRYETFSDLRAAPRDRRCVRELNSLFEHYDRNDRVDATDLLLFPKWEAR